MRTIGERTAGIGRSVRAAEIALHQRCRFVEIHLERAASKDFEFDKGRKAVKVLESGTPANRDQWVEERVNIASDYRRRFRVEKVLDPIGLSLLTDADDTQSLAEGDYADFRLCRE